MFKAIAIGSFLMTVVAQAQGPAGTLVVPLKIEAVPARTFGRGKPARAA